MDVQAVSEEEGVAVLEIRRDVVFEDAGLRGIRGEQHDHVCPLGSFRIVLHGEAGFFSLGAGLGTFAQADNNLHAGFAQVLCVRVTLGAVTDDRDLATLDQGEVCIVFVKYVDSHGESSFRCGSADSIYTSSPFHLVRWG